MIQHFLIRVKEVKSDTWYLDCKGLVFHTIKFPNSEIYYLTPFLYFFDRDVEIVKENINGLVGVISPYNYAQNETRY